MMYPVIENEKQKKQEGPYVEIVKTPEYMAAVDVISRFVKALPLDVAHNDELVKTLLEFTDKARHDAFLQGMDMSLKIANGIKKTKKTKRRITI